MNHRTKNIPISGTSKGAGAATERLLDERGYTVFGTLRTEAVCIITS